jgi:hypothetical protein
MRLCPLDLSATRYNCDDSGPVSILANVSLTDMLAKGRQTGGHNLSSGRSSFKPKSISRSVLVNCMVAFGSVKSNCPLS